MIEGAVAKRDDKHPIRWESASSDEVQYLTVVDAVQRIARAYEKPDAQQITADLMLGVKFGTGWAFYQYEDPS